MTARDAADIHRLYADKEATRFGYSPKMDGQDDARALIAQLDGLAAQRTLFQWGVVLADEDAIIGHVTLFEWHRASRRAEIGYSVLRARWGRGIGTAAVRVILRFAFEDLDLRRVEADVEPRNTASVRLLERLGFQREGVLRERWEIQGEIQDALLLGLLRSEWRR